MESVRGNNSKMKVPKAKTLNENVSPLQIEMDDQRGRYLQSMTMSPRFQPYAENIDVGSPLVRYFLAGSPISGKVTPAGEAFTSPTFGSSKYRSAIVQQYCGNSSYGSRGRMSLSPLSTVENFEIAPLMSPPMYGTPVKVDEEGARHSAQLQLLFLRCSLLPPSNLNFRFQTLTFRSRKC